jgi:hypothetical protein
MHRRLSSTSMRIWRLAWCVALTAAALLAAATSPASGDVFPTSVDFGALPPGSTSGAIPITKYCPPLATPPITDAHPTPRPTAVRACRIVDVELEGSGDFGLDGSSCFGRTLAPNTTCRFTVSFTPTACGARSETVALVQLITFATDDPAQTLRRQHTVTLRGRGLCPTPPPADVFPSAVDFGAQRLGTTGNAIPVTKLCPAVATPPVSDANPTPGPAPVRSCTIVDVLLGGQDPNDFRPNGAGCFGRTLAPNTTCSFTVSFTPTACGERSATLTFVQLIIFASGDAPLRREHTVTFAGRGICPTV